MNWQEALEGFVDRGGGLLWSLGSQVNFEALNDDTRRLFGGSIEDFIGLKTAFLEPRRWQFRMSHSLTLH